MKPSGVGAGPKRSRDSAGEPGAVRSSSPTPTVLVRSGDSDEAQLACILHVFEESELVDAGVYRFAHVKGAAMTDAVKLSDEELMERLVAGPRSGSTWRHYKTGNLYIVHGIAIQESTQEVVVIYSRRLNSVVVAILFVRPLSEWDEEVEWQDQRVRRFTEC